MKDALALDSLDTCTPSDRIPCAWEVGPPGMRQGFGGKLSCSGHRRYNGDLQLPDRTPTWMEGSPCLGHSSPRWRESVRLNSRPMILGIWWLVAWRTSEVLTCASMDGLDGLDGLEAGETGTSLHAGFDFRQKFFLSGNHGPALAHLRGYARLAGPATGKLSVENPGESTSILHSGYSVEDHHHVNSVTRWWGGSSVDPATPSNAKHAVMSSGKDLSWIVRLKRWKCSGVYKERSGARSRSKMDE